ncbi:wd and tetratricopeptide repeat protein [Aspergillus campestris IBT 28561]|uniref:Wd and tetratricopeptide repeat protein n=1 Tax=Aspergillus campestris (strain IBT 28561) TaxID=1392248 RepID=A0A2I1D4J9_ASPC2|nr:wd and tetratricopeptide repeat protein [Aspergillus campestris IBT 28561]PKY04804.1 wd and tetratricopeptide repeat protein [Aspergillus campestris IBT 28561]
MKNHSISLYDRIWRREAGDASPSASIRGLYGSKEWIDNLDIVNELGGHTGCVNALSWSRSGQLLASGSDDHNLNIYSYQPDSSTAPFALNTTVFTGHRANIFSVKFMPHSNDRTVVTCAGDSQVRVFDIEHAAANRDVAATSALSASARSQNFNNFFTNTRYLSEGNTNVRVYRSHADRVKRIVTESSPHLFLTCSEDGEVRQWDLRQPSSAYPKPRGGQGFMAYRPGLVHDDSNVPPPLISYKRYQLDLNTISCSPSQPHYIALGGAHLHCFLHDRRMLGRDRIAETGAPTGAPPRSMRDDEVMGQATRCVRRFAPGGRRHMNPRSEGHITACKISDANPNEMVVSWSGDHIYSFDLIRSPDAAAARARGQSVRQTHDPRRVAHARDRKRKRQKQPSTSSTSSGTQPRRRSRPRDEDPELKFRVRYGNGALEDISIPSLADTVGDTQQNVFEQARYAVLNDAQRLGMEIAKGLVKLRKALFSLDAAVREWDGSTEEAPYADALSTALTQASRSLPRMTAVMRDWRYPLNPTCHVVNMQQTLRHNRESSWRFVQAAGTLAKALGADVRETAASDDENDDDDDDVDAGEQFDQIRLAPGENNSVDRSAQFGYDFLKSILLFFAGGREAVRAGFQRNSAARRNQARFPLAAEADDSAIESVLIPYLQRLAGDDPVVNVDASRFEHDSSRILFPTQQAAVTAFSRVVQLPLEDLGSAASRADPGTGEERSDAPPVRALDRSAAARFWQFKVGRGVLMAAGSGVNYAFVNQAFGGLRMTVEDESEESEGAVPERSQDDTEATREEEPIRDVRLMIDGGSPSGSPSDPQSQPGHRHETTIGRMSASGNAEINEDFFEWKSREDTEVDGEPDGPVEDDDDDDDDDDGEDESEDETSVSEDEEDNLGNLMDDSSDANDDDDDDLTGDYDIDADDGSGNERLLRNYGFQRTKRHNVHSDIPCSSHTRVYRGHCNVKTVKDVNYYGMDDEYVVSGSDSGHVFIWDRKTCDLVNILEGDSEVVNVVQGHPYEPTIAASGIDNTIKIFSPDRHAQENARRGINILDPNNPANALGPNVDSSIGGLKSCKRMHDSYRIMNQNDVNRQGGLDDAFITRNMLAEFASALRERQVPGGAGNNPGVQDGPALVLDDNCSVM